MKKILLKSIANKREQSIFNFLKYIYPNAFNGLKFKSQNMHE